MTPMVDRTVAQRVKRYRALQKRERGIVRVEVQVPAAAAEDIKFIGRKLHAACRKLEEARREIGFVLGTINAPRPHPIDAMTLMRCLTASRADARWRPHVAAFFDELSPEAVHDLVLAGLVSFEDLYRAARTWRMTDGGNVAWIKEMADLRLARAAA
jgi:hypothetical protein